MDKIRIIDEPLAKRCFALNLKPCSVAGPAERMTLQIPQATVTLGTKLEHAQQAQAETIASIISFDIQIRKF